MKIVKSDTGKIRYLSVRQLLKALTEAAEEMGDDTPVFFVAYGADTKVPEIVYSETLPMKNPHIPAFAVCLYEPVPAEEAPIFPTRDKHH